MTNTDLRIKIAEAKGWTNIVAPRNGRGCGIPPEGDQLHGFHTGLPDYPGDPREWAGLLEEMRRAGAVKSIHPSKAGYRIGFMAKFAGDMLWQSQHAPTLGRAVCLAWLAWHAARSGEGE